MKKILTHLVGIGKAIVYVISFTLVCHNMLLAQKKIVPTWTSPYFGNGVRYNYDGSKAITFGKKGTSLWNIVNYALLFNFFGHTDRVMDAKFSKDDKRIVTVSLDGTAIVWDAYTGLLIRVLNNTSSGIIKVDINETGTEIITCDLLGNATLWNVSTGKGKTISGSDRAYDVCYSNNYQQVLVVSSRMKLYDVKSYDVIKEFYEVGVSNLSAEFNSAGDRLLSFNSGQASLWNVKTGSFVRSFKGHSTKVYTAHFNAKGDRVITAGDDNARVWDVKTGEELFSLNGHSGDVINAIFGLNDSVISTATESEVKIWDAYTQELKNVMNPLHNANTKLSFHPKGDRILISGGQNECIDWDFGIDKIVKRWLDCYPSYEKIKSRISFSKQGDLVLATCSEVNIWKVDNGELQCSIADSINNSPICSALNNEATQVATVFYDGSVSLWDVSTGKKLRTISKGGDDAVFHNGEKIYTGNSSTLNSYDSQTGSLLNTHKLAAGTFYIQGNNKKNRLILDTYNKSGMVWDVVSEKEITGLGANPKLSEDNKKVFSGRKTIKIHDVETGKELWDLPTDQLLKDEYNSYYIPVSFVFNERTNKVVIAWYNGAITLHDFDTGVELKRLAEPSLAYTSDVKGNKNGNYFITYSDSVRLWDMKSGNVIAVLENFDNHLFKLDVGEMIFSDDDRYCALFTYKGEVRVWDVFDAISSVSESNYETNERMIHISPNPTGGSITIEATLGIGVESKYGISNSLGEIVMTGENLNPVNNTISVDILENGVYYLTIYSQSHKLCGKFVVCH